MEIERGVRSRPKKRFLPIVVGAAGWTQCSWGRWGSTVWGVFVSGGGCLLRSVICCPISGSVAFLSPAALAPLPLCISTWGDEPGITERRYNDVPWGRGHAKPRYLLPGCTRRRGPLQGPTGEVWCLTHGRGDTRPPNLWLCVVSAEDIRGTCVGRIMGARGNNLRAVKWALRNRITLAP